MNKTFLNIQLCIYIRFTEVNPLPFLWHLTCALLRRWNISVVAESITLDPFSCLFISLPLVGAIPECTDVDDIYIYFYELNVNLCTRWVCELLSSRIVNKYFPQTKFCLLSSAITIIFKFRMVIKASPVQVDLFQTQNANYQTNAYTTSDLQPAVYLLKTFCNCTTHKMITEPVGSGSKVILEFTHALMRIIKILLSLKSPECSIDFLCIN